MESPLPSETLLQNRYKLLNVLGQGGFGRTYLAEDQGRFNELCALKELIPPETGAYALDKSKELFQREATTLYQIKHPQVPQFRANFEQDGRLFLVQDYVEGKTYRELLNERKAQTVIQPPNANPANPVPNQGSNGVFSESEVRSLLLQLLPVLDHLHSKSIIHRDITPDNIILRDSDRMPVLIDFGVVKELATRFLSPNASAPLTTVGKVGYAPSEQIQTGRAYPSSDLYSLAVSAVVLLTGKEPQSLFDDNQLTWNWQRWVDVSDDFATVLNRMLNYRPGDRYQSANEVMQALQSPLPASPPQPPPLPIPQPPQQPAPNVSQVATMAVGRRPEPPSSGRDPRIPEPASDALTDNPWVVIGIGTALALVAGLGAWAITSSLTNNRQNEQVAQTPLETPLTTPLPTATETLSPTPSPTPTPTPTPTPATTQAPQSTTASARLALQPGKSLLRSGTLKANSTVNYIIRGEQNERLSATLAGEGVLMTVIAPDQNPVSDQAVRVQRWDGKLPLSGEYTLQLRPVKGVSNSDYKLTINSEVPPTPTPTPTPAPTPTPTSTQPVEYQSESVSLPGGLGSIELLGRTSPRQIQRYLVNVKKGQTLAVKVPQTVAASVDVRYPNGKLIPDASGAKVWQAIVPRDGVYKIDVIAPKRTDFALNISVSQ